MIFKSRQVNLDPKSWCSVAAGDSGYRSAYQHLNDAIWWAPRPEFEPTRDPEPWIIHLLRLESTVRAPYYDGEGITAERWEWAPRRDQFDTPVNPILMDLRVYKQERQAMNNPKGWAHVLSRFEGALAVNPWDATREQIDHAKRVLYRLAEWSK